MLKKMCLLLALLILCVCVSKVTEEKVPLRQPEQISVEELDRVKHILAGEEVAEISQEKAPFEEDVNQPEVEEIPEYEYPFTYTADDGKEYVVMRLETIDIETWGAMIDFMEKREFDYNPARLSRLFKFEKENGKVKLIGWTEEELSPTERFNDLDESGFFGNEYNAGEYSTKAFSFLCDENAIRKCFEEYGIETIKNIFTIYDHRGYIIAAITENEAYYMTVPTASEKYGDFVFQKIYTHDAFEKVYGPCLAKVFVDGKEIEYFSASVHPMRGYKMEKYHLELELVRLAEVLGVKCEYDEKNDIIKFGDCIIKKDNLWHERFGKAGVLEPGKAYNAGIEAPDFSTDYDGIGCIIESSGKKIASFSLVKWLAERYGYRVEINFEDNSVRFYAAKNENS